MFLNVCKQTFHISHVRKSQKLKGVLKWNFHHIIFIWRRRYRQIFQICIGVPWKHLTLSHETTKASRNHMSIWSLNLTSCRHVVSWGFCVTYLSQIHENMVCWSYLLSARMQLYAEQDKTQCTRYQLSILTRRNRLWKIRAHETTTLRNLIWFPANQFNLSPYKGL